MKIFKFIKKLIQAESAESSKRFIALMIVVLITYTVVRFTDYKNYIDVLIVLRNFVLVLAGVGTAQAILKKDI